PLRPARASSSAPSPHLCPPPHRRQGVSRDARPRVRFPNREGGSPVEPGLLATPQRKHRVSVSAAHRKVAAARETAATDSYEPQFTPCRCHCYRHCSGTFVVFGLDMFMSAHLSMTSMTPRLLGLPSNPGLL